MQAQAKRTQKVAAENGLKAYSIVVKTYDANSVITETYERIDGKELAEYRFKAGQKRFTRTL